MKTTSSAEALLKSDRETTAPLVSASRKSGAFVPSDNIVELTATMQGIWNASNRLSNPKTRFSILVLAGMKWFLTRLLREPCLSDECLAIRLAS